MAKQVNGWTVLYNAEDLRIWEEENHVVPEKVPTGYPCLADTELNSCEDIVAVFYTQADLAKMFVAINTPE